MENEEKREIEVEKKDKKEKRKQIIDISRPFGKLFFYVIATIVLVLVFFMGIKFSKEFHTQEKTTKFGLENVGELVTQTCHTTVIEDSKVNREFFNLFEIPFTESRQIFSYDFEIDASINFDDLEISKIDDRNKIIIVTIPHSKIYKITLNPESLKVYLDSESLFSRIDLISHNAAVLKMQEQAKNDCVANNLLTSSDNNARVLISSIINGNDKYKNYKVEFIYKESE